MAVILSLHDHLEQKQERDYRLVELKIKHDLNLLRNALDIVEHLPLDMLPAVFLRSKQRLKQGK